MSTFSQTLAAGQIIRLPGGDSFSIIKAIYDLTVELKRDGKRVEKGKNVPAAWRFMPAVIVPGKPAFDEVVITSEIAQTIEVDISHGLSGVNAIAGQVSTLDGALDVVKDGRGFMISYGQAAVAAEYSALQILNPAASGVLVYVNKLLPHSIGTAITMRIGQHDTMLSSGSGAIGNKDYGGTAGKAKMRGETNAAKVGILPLHTLEFPADEFREVPISEPILLREGRGLICEAGTVNVQINLSVQYVEEPI